MPSSLHVLTAVDIEAGAGRVWDVLIDLASYADWNPMIRCASGRVEQGARLRLHFEPPGSKGRDFKPMLLEVEAGRALAWRGQPSVRGLLTSRHYFRIEPLGAGSCRLEHGMHYSGLLVPMLRRKLQASTAQPFELMNAALKTRAERGPGSGD